MATELELIQQQLYKAVNLISYKPPIDHTNFTRVKLEDDLVMWMTELIDYIGSGAPNNLYNADGILAGDRMVSMNGHSLNLGGFVVEDGGSVTSPESVTADSYVVSGTPDTDNSLSQLFAFNSVTGVFHLLDKSSITGSNTNIYNTSSALTGNRYLDTAGYELEMGVSTNASPAMKFHTSGSLVDFNAAAYFYNTVYMQGTNIILQPSTELTLYGKVATSNTVTSVLAIDGGGTSGFVRLVDMSGFEGISIYNADGNLLGNRSISGQNTYSLRLGGTLNTEQLTDFEVRSALGNLKVNSTFEYTNPNFGKLFFNNSHSLVVGLNSTASGIGGVSIGGDITNSSDYAFAITDTASIAVGSDGSAIIGGDSNSVSTTNAIVLGMESFSATTANTTYVNNLYVDNTVKLDSYGSGTNTGTITYYLGVDANGNIIEGAGGTSVTYDVGTVTPTGVDKGSWFYDTSSEILYLRAGDESGDFWLDIQASIGGTGTVPTMVCPEEKLTTSSLLSIPLTMNSTYQLVFAGVSITTDPDVEIDAAGEVTINTKGCYRIVVGSNASTTSTGDRTVFFRIMVNGVQHNGTYQSSFSTNGVSNSLVADVLEHFDVNDTITFEVLASGTNCSLDTHDPSGNDASWTVPSSSMNLKITKLILE